jgi:altronate hydrolase
MAKRAILLDAQDSVAVAVTEIQSGEIGEVTGADSSTVTLKERIPSGHKIALMTILKGEQVIKYGYSIGVAQSDIERGSWVHSHNLASGLHGLLEYKAPDTIYSWKGVTSNIPIPKTFKGYRRMDGSVGIRNEIWIIPTVGCVNKAVEAIRHKARTELGLDAVCFTHPYGCSQLGDDLVHTQKILAGLVKHPNAAGVLVVSLGCENNRLERFKEALGSWDDNRVKFLSMQEVADEEAEAMRLLKELGDFAAQFRREEFPVSELVLGMKCGGSDGFSGITANPLVGRIADLLIQSGGSVMLSEVPEMFGAETVLMNRACSKEVFHRIVSLVNDFKAYFIRHGQEVYENPSPGNRDGGITTLEEKSLGCIRKAGTSPVMDVVPYGAPRQKKGLTLLSGPGNDLVSATALSAAGAHMILFTTGRGTPFGAPSPTVKISSNTDLAVRKAGWIDYDAGRLLAGKSFDELGADLFSFIVEVANGKKTRSEITGNRDMAIFKDGVTL